MAARRRSAWVRSSVGHPTVRPVAHPARPPVRLATLDGGRSPSLTGAQRLPVPPTLPDDGGRSGRSLLHDPAGYAVLATSLGATPDDLEREIARRSAFMAALEERGICSPAGVAAAVMGYPDLPASGLDRPAAQPSQGASA